MSSLGSTDGGADVSTDDPRVATHTSAQGVAGLHVVVRHRGGGAPSCFLRPRFGNAPFKVEADGSLACLPVCFPCPPALPLQASPWLRSAAVGAFDTAQGPEALNATQRYLLSAVGAARSTGLLQTEATRATGVAPNNFFYQVQRLEQRGLLVKHQVTAAGTNGVVSTSALLLPQYHMAFMAAAAGGGPGGGDVDMEDAEGGAGPSTAAGPTAGSRKLVGSLLGDYATCALVCQHLESCPNNSCSLVELKSLLGEGAARHRVWRRIVPHLNAAGCISIGTAQLALPPPIGADGGDGDAGAPAEGGAADNGNEPMEIATPALRRDSPVVTLVKPWVAPPSGAQLAMQQSAPSLLPGVAARSVLYADVPMEAQLMALVAAAGPQGITHTALLSSLGLTYTDRDSFARLNTRLVPANVVVQSMGHLGRVSAKMFRVAEDVQLAVEYTPGATAAQLVMDLEAPGDGAGAGALTLLSPSAPAGSWVNLTEHRRKVILDAVRAQGMVLPTHLQVLIQASLPPGAPKVDRKTVDNAVTALEKEGLLRSWTVEMPVKAKEGKMRAHVLLIRPLQPGEHPDAGKDMEAAKTVIANFSAQTVRKQRKSMKATRLARGGAGGGATPLLALPGGADDEDEDEEADAAPEGELLPATQRARCRRRLGVLRARCTRSEHLHAWLHSSTAGSQPGQWAAFTLEDAVIRMPVHLVLLFLGFNGDKRLELEEEANANDGGSSFSEAFCLRVETAASAEGAAGLVSALSAREQQLLLNSRTQGFLCESATLLLGLGLLQVPSPPPPAPAAEPTSAVKWGERTALVVASSAVIEEPQLGQGGLAAVTAATPWSSATLTLSTLDDVAAYWRRLQAAVAPLRGPKDYEKLAALHLPCTRLPKAAVITQKDAWKRPMGALALKPGQRAALFAHARALWPVWRATAAEDADMDDPASLAASSPAIQALAAKLGCGKDEAAKLLRDERAAFLRECTVTAGAALTAIVRGAPKAAMGKGKAKRAASDAAAGPDVVIAPAAKRRRPAKDPKMTVAQVRQVVANAARTAVNRSDMMVPSTLNFGLPAIGGAHGDGGGGGHMPPPQPSGPVVEAPARFGSHRPSGMGAAGGAGPSGRGDVRMDSGDEEEESESESDDEPMPPAQAAIVMVPGPHARARPGGKAAAFGAKGPGAKHAGGARQTHSLAPSTPLPQVLPPPPSGPLTVASRCAMELLKLHLLHGVAATLAQAAAASLADAPGSAMSPPWAGLCGPAATWDLQQSLDAHSPGQDAIRAGLRTLGEAAVADGLARLRAAGHVTPAGAPQLTRAFWEAAALAPGFAADVGLAVATLASRVAATVAGGEPEHPAGGDEHPPGGGGAAAGEQAGGEVYSVVLFPGTGVSRPTDRGAAMSLVLHSGDVAAALTAVATGAARLVMAPPREAGGGLDALVPPQQDGPPKAEALYRSLQLRLARTSGDDDADDTAQEGGGESGFPPANGGGVAGKPPGGGGQAAAGGAKRARGKGGEEAAAPRGGAGTCQPDVTLDACCTRWRTAKKGASDAPLRAAWAALQAGGANGVVATPPLFTEAELAFLAEPCGACLAVSAADCDQAGTVYVRAGDVGPYAMPLPIGSGHPSHGVALVLHDLCAARACALAMRLPGAPEQVLTHHLSAVAPSHAAALLHQLVTAGKLISRSVRTAAPAGPRSRLHRPVGDEAEVAHFFPAPAAVQCV